jgi:hypothetical protein
MGYSTRQDYYTAIREAADEAAENVREYDADPGEAANEAADGFAVYYSDARDIMRHTDNPDAFAEFGFDFTGEPWDGIVSTCAACAAHRDVSEAFWETYDEDGHALDGSTREDEDTTEGGAL